jgi:hypothetical protein
MATKTQPKKSTPARSSAPAEENNKLAVRPPTAALTRSNADDLLEQNAGQGLENVSARDMAIPRISILQSGSPQVKKSEGAYIKGAEEGDFYNNISNSVQAKGDEGMKVVLVSYRRTFIEWILKSAGGGFVRDCGPSEAILGQCKKDADGRMILPNGHQIVETAEFYAFVMDKDGNNPRQAVMSMTSTQLKKSRRLITLTNELRFPRKNGNGTYNPPLYASIFDVNTVPESNEKGSWMGWNFTRAGNTADLEGGSDLLYAAADFYKAVSGGSVIVAAPVDDGGAVSSGHPDDGDSL